MSPTGRLRGRGDQADKCQGPFYTLTGLFKCRDSCDSGELTAQSKAGRCRDAQNSGGPCPAG